MAPFDQIRLLHLKETPTFSSLDIEVDKIWQKRRKRIYWIRKIRNSR